MDQIARTMKACLALLILLNLGMVGLYILQLRLADDVRALAVVGRDPISARWYDSTGTEFVVTKGAGPHDNFDQQTSALAERLASMQRQFLPVRR